MLIAKKLGLLAIFGKVFFGFLKPILLGIVALLAVFKNRIMGLFGRKTNELEGLSPVSRPASRQPRSS